MTPRRLPLLVRVLLWAPLQPRGQAPAPAGAPHQRPDTGECTPAGSRPLLWEAERGGRQAFVAGVLDLGGGAPEIPPAVKEALGCAGVAAFEEACSAADGLMANYSVHCRSYAGIEDGGSVAARLPPSTLKALKASLDGFLARGLPQLRPHCAAALAAALRGPVDALGSVTGGITLRALLEELLRALGPGGCGSAGANSSSQGYEDRLRGAFGPGRPQLGLIDVQERCDWLQRASVAEDTELAEQMADKFSDLRWLEAQVGLAADLAEAARCGDLDKVMEVLTDGKLMLDNWRSGPSLRSVNEALAAGIERTLHQHPGKIVFSAVDAVHLFGPGSALLCLENLGFDVRPVAAGEDLGCEPPKAAAAGGQGAKERPPRQCLMPPDLAQPASCGAFAAQLGHRLGGDVLHGRHMSHERCDACLADDVSCTCNVTWQNDSAFARLCEDMTVGDVYGQVYELDFTRRGGGQEKTIRGLYQKCYASSCDQDMVALRALREWHASDPSLLHGSVDLRPRRGPGPVSTSPEPEPPGEARRADAWPPWAWALFLGTCACCAATLAASWWLRRGKLAGHGRRKATSAVPTAPPPPRAREPGFLAAARHGDAWDEQLPLNASFGPQQEGQTSPRSPGSPLPADAAPVWLPVFSRAVQIQQALQGAGESAAQQMREALRGIKAQADSFQPMEMGTLSPTAAQVRQSPRQHAARGVRN